MPANSRPTLLHELAHMVGGDGSKRFGYALTDLLAQVARRHTALAALEVDWRQGGAP